MPLLFCWAALVACAPVAPIGDEETATGWTELEPGLELGSLQAPGASQSDRDRIHVLRVDPERFDLRLLNSSATENGRPQTARQWSVNHGLVAAINAGMYQEDYRTGVSLMRTREHVNNPHLTRHMSVLAFDPLAQEVPPVRIIDLECERFEEWSSRYGSLVQSIRMRSCNGDNVWQPQPQRWSTAAIGTDLSGRVLLIHVGMPYRTHDLIDLLDRLPLALDRLMYAEGGSKAQLFVRGPERDFDFVGVFESPLGEGEGPASAWPIPNALGVVRR